MRTLVALTLLCAACSTRPAAPAPAPPPPAPAALDPKQVEFCVQNFEKSMACFKDDGYWDVLATLYFAQNPTLPGDAAAKQHWIGILKDDMVGLAREHRFDENCRAMLAHNQAPKPSTMATVSAARGKSCADFANAFGWMIFGEGAFHKPKS